MADFLRDVLTQRWWEHDRHNYELVTSQYVLDEAAHGELTLAAERLQALVRISASGPSFRRTPNCRRDRKSRYTPQRCPG